MTTGDEPQLGGEERDNAQGDLAPMISGRGTKIIADARGAYLAGNHKALFEAMTPEQQLIYRQEVIRQMLACIRPEVEQAASDFPALYEILHELEAWISFPTGDHHQRINERRFSDAFHASNNPLMVRLHCVMSGATDSEFGAIVNATEVLLYRHPRVWSPEPHSTILRRLVRGWELETEWAVIQGKPAPPLRADAETIRGLAADLEHWHRAKDVQVLIQLLSAAQCEQFKRAVQQQAVYYIDTLPIDVWPARLHGWIERVHHWLAHPDAIDPTLHDARSSLEGYDPAHRAIYGLLGAFINPTNRDQLDLLVAGAAAGVLYYITMMADGSSTVHAIEAFNAARRWQADAAYAIMTDQPLPPLGADQVAGSAA